MKSNGNSISSLTSLATPTQKRTIFSCMWPECTKNYDSLEDIELHVRAHFG